MPATYDSLGTLTAVVNGDLQFVNIPQTYTDLVLVGSVKGTTATALLGFYFGVNGTYGSGSNLYSWNNLDTTGSSVTGSNFINQPFWGGTFGNPGTTAPADTYGTLVVHIMNYSNTTTNKTVIGRSSSLVSGNLLMVESVLLWRQTEAINSIFMATPAAIAAGSIFSLYGIKAA